MNLKTHIETTIGAALAAITVQINEFVALVESEITLKSGDLADALQYIKDNAETPLANSQSLCDRLYYLSTMNVEADVTGNLQWEYIGKDDFHNPTRVVGRFGSPFEGVRVYPDGTVRAKYGVVLPQDQFDAAMSLFEQGDKAAEALKEWKKKLCDLRDTITYEIQKVPRDWLVIQKLLKVGNTIHCKGVTLTTCRSKEITPEWFKIVSIEEGGVRTILTSSGKTYKVKRDEVVFYLNDMQRMAPDTFAKFEFEEAPVQE